MYFSVIFCTFAAAKARSPSPNPLIVLTVMKTEIAGYIVATIGQMAESYPSHGIKVDTIHAINGHCEVRVTSNESRECNYFPAYLLSRLQSVADAWAVLLWIESDHDTGVLTAYIS